MKTKIGIKIWPFWEAQTAEYLDSEDHENQ